MINFLIFFVTFQKISIIINYINTKINLINTMRLLKIEHPINGIWYFTSAIKAAVWLETSASNIYTSMKNGKTVKDWSLEWVEEDNILSQYINPANKEINTIELLEKAIKMLEENEKEISSLKEIASNINDKIEDKNKL